MGQLVLCGIDQLTVLFSGSHYFSTDFLVVMDVPLVGMIEKRSVFFEPKKEAEAV
jgi:hypothetical protein